MAEIKITDLPTETEITDTHLFIVQNGNSDTKTVSMSKIKEYVDSTATIISSALVYTGTLTTSGWNTTAIPYTQTFDIDNINSELSPVIDLVVSDDTETGVVEVNEWLKVTKAVSGDGTITFMCYQQVPTVDLNVKIKVV